MTPSKLKELFKIEMANLIEKGLEVPVVRPILTDDGNHVAGCDHNFPKPHTHELWTDRPFIFDIRKIPDSFHGFKLYVFVKHETKPEEFRSPERTEEDKKNGVWRIIRFEEVYAPEKVLAYAKENVLDICTQLNDYTFTLKDICDMIVGFDFEEHKKECEEIRLRQLLD